jgi:hypothetical protein
MEGDFMRRLFTIAATAAALAVPASVATAGFVQAGPAGAAGSSIACSSVKLKGSLAGGTLEFSKCTPSGGKGYKDATASTAALEVAGSNLTWSKSGATTTVSITASSPGQGVCPKNYLEYDANGTVTAASTSGVGIPAVGDVISGTACVDVTKNKLKLASGTTFNL